MAWLQSVFGGESAGITLVLIVLALAVALVLLFWIFRKIAGDNALKTGRSRQPRLSVTDAAVVDDKRRLVLVRRDNVEHLVMIGGPTDIVIEQNIARARPAAPVAHHEGAHRDVARPEVTEPGGAHPAPPRPRRAAEATGAEPPRSHTPLQETTVGLAASATGSTIAAAALQRQQAVAGAKSGYASRQPQAEAPTRPVEHGEVETSDFDADLAGALEPAEAEEEEAFAGAREAAETPSVDMEPETSASREIDDDLSELLAEDEAARAEEVPSVDTVMLPEDQPGLEPRRRAESMEDEMQRLLDELAGQKSG